jgi:protein phosphatase
MIPISAHGTTYPGRREVNQDDILQCYPSPKSFFFAVADGMGGTAGGQIASETALTVAEEYLEDCFEDEGEIHSRNLKSILATLFGRAQDAIRKVTEERPQLDGMGTTLSCVLGYDDRFVVGNLGDSRVYHLHQGTMRQVTEDHSYLQEFKKRAGDKKLDPEFVAQYGHIINRTLDGGDDEPDLFPEADPYFTLHEQDGFLLCSDGLIVDKAKNKEQLFKSYLLGTPDLKTAAESLVSLAFYLGSTDNISVILAEAGTLKRRLGHVRTYPFPPQQEQHA